MVTIIITIIYQCRNIGSKETHNNNNNEAELSFPRSDSHPWSLRICKVGHMLRFCQLFHSLTLIRPNLIFTHQTKTLTHLSLLAYEEENLPYEELLARQGRVWRQKDGKSKEGLYVHPACASPLRDVLLVPGGGSERIPSFLTAPQATGLFLYHLIFIQDH